MAMDVVMVLLWLGKPADNRDGIIGAKGCVEVVLAAGLAWLSLMLVVHDSGSGKRREKKERGWRKRVAVNVTVFVTVIRDGDEWSRRGREREGQGEGRSSGIANFELRIVNCQVRKTKRRNCKMPTNGKG